VLARAAGRPGGVERLPDALRGAGLRERLGAEDAGRLLPGSTYSPERDEATGLLNPAGLERFSLALADRLMPLLARGRFCLVLGGDCSILLGAALALRRRGRFGLAFIDGHTDFYSPSTSPTGEAADMDLHEVRSMGTTAAAQRALARLEAGLDGFWVHLDADVLDDRVMPAVDYRMPDGLRPEELSALLGQLLASPGATGMTVSILNPALDATGNAVRVLVEVLAAAFRRTQRRALA
jgi:arginase